MPVYDSLVEKEACLITQAETCSVVLLDLSFPSPFFFFLLIRPEDKS